MSTQDRIGRLAQQLGERLQGASHAPEEFQRGVQQVVRGAFDRLELVSREDFDILMEVLQRTRSRVEALEKQVAALEAALDKREERSSALAAGSSSTASQDKAPAGSKKDAKEKTSDAKRKAADNTISDTEKSRRPDA